MPGTYEHTPEELREQARAHEEEQADMAERSTATHKALRSMLDELRGIRAAVETPPTTTSYQDPAITGE
jgi:hypothetical protein